MSTFTKAQLIARINQVTAINKYRISRDPDADGLAMDNELLAIALASLEAEPVAWRHDDGPFAGIAMTRAKSVAEKWIANGWKVTPLYTAPPEPLSVPDLKELEEILDWILMLPCPTPKATHFAKRLAVVIDTCRSAMLQGADGNSPVIPDGWVACSERMPERDYVLAADFSGKQYPANLPNIQIGIYADWFDDGSPCWDDGDGNDLHLKQVTHWAQIPAAPQQEVK